MELMAKLQCPEGTKRKIGVGRAYAPPPSEPDRRYSRIRLSS